MAEKDISNKEAVRLMSELIKSVTTTLVKRIDEFEKESMEREAVRHTETVQNMTALAKIISVSTETKKTTRKTAAASLAASVPQNLLAFFLQVYAVKPEVLACLPNCQFAVDFIAAKYKGKAAIDKLTDTQKKALFSAMWNHLLAQPEEATLDLVDMEGNAVEVTHAALEEMYSTYKESCAAGAAGADEPDMPADESAQVDDSIDDAVAAAAAAVVEPEPEQPKASRARKPAAAPAAAAPAAAKATPAKAKATPAAAPAAVAAVAAAAAPAKKPAAAVAAAKPAAAAAAAPKKR